MRTGQAPTDAAAHRRSHEQMLRDADFTVLVGEYL